MENKEKVHYCPNYLMSPTHPVTITVIGCGGTGSFLLSRLARLDFALRQLEHPGLHVHVIDGDIIELHNAGRQNFTENEVGKYKASTMVEKINFAFGLDWESTNKMIKVSEIIPSNFIITCVDSAKFRMSLHENLNKISNGNRAYNSPYYWLDCGNGKDFGQVILSTIREIPQPKSKEFETFSKLKSVVDIYGDLENFDNKESQGIESCSFRESLEKQDLFINDIISTIAADLIMKLLRFKRISIHGAIVNQGTYKQTGILIK